MDEDLADESASKPSGQHWPEFREWANVFTALAALLLGVVSFWTTTRVAGLEDYLRSEIVRRNSDLDDLATRSNSLRQQAETNAGRLEDLRASTDRILAVSSEAQNSLLGAQARLNDVRYEVTEANRELGVSKARLATLDNEVTDQRKQLDVFRLNGVYETALLRISLLRLDQSNDIQSLGAKALDDLRNYGIEDGRSELSSYFEIIRRDAPRICRSLENFSPIIPAKKDIPEGPRRTGKREVINGVVSYSMTNKEYDQWTVNYNQWLNDLTDFEDFNENRNGMLNRAQEYVAEFSTYCLCRALANASPESQTFCPNQNRPSPPDLG